MFIFNEMSAQIVQPSSCKTGELVFFGVHKTSVHSMFFSIMLLITEVMGVSIWHLMPQNHDGEASLHRFQRCLFAMSFSVISVYFSQYALFPLFNLNRCLLTLVDVFWWKTMVGHCFQICSFKLSPSFSDTTHRFAKYHKASAELAFVCGCHCQPISRSDIVSLQNRSRPAVSDSMGGGHHFS